MQSSDTYDTAVGDSTLVKRPLSLDGLNERQPTDVDSDIRSVSSVSDDLPEHVNLLYIATLEHGDIDTTYASDLKQLLNAHVHNFYEIPQ